MIYKQNFTSRHSVVLAAWSNLPHISKSRYDNFNYIRDRNAKGNNRVFDLARRKLKKFRSGSLLTYAVLE
jgi:hypothetical protein